MFGYVLVHKPELKIKEYEYYRATYCGLCKAIGKQTGQVSRLSLNYDFVYLALIRMILEESDVKFGKIRCLLHPFKKRSAALSCEALDFSARAAILLTCLKIEDNIQDENGIKKALTYSLYPFSSHLIKKSIKKESDFLALEELLRKGLTELLECEKNNQSSVDYPAYIFGKILGEIFKFGINDTKKAKIAYEIGLHTGKWIYITDALDDMLADKKKNSYNPFLILYNGDIPDELSLSGIENALKNELFSLENAIDLLDFGKNTIIQNIIYNIIYLGLPMKVSQVLAKYKSPQIRKETKINE